MRFLRYGTLFFITALSGSLHASISMDPLWLFKDLETDEKLFGSMIVRDTSRSYEFNTIYPTDTGDAYDGQYINFPYRFSTDTLKVFDEFDPNTILYRDYRPGYAGFKIDWDNGVTGFALARYKYIRFAHKGPLPDHKISVRFGYNKECGSPTVFQSIGSCPASSEWRVDSILIPDSLHNIPQSEVLTRNYYEMQVLITNTDPAGSMSSDSGLLKVDDIALVDTTGAIAVIMPPKVHSAPDTSESPENCGCGAGTILAFLPPLFFKARSIRKRKKKCPLQRT
jgi:hypothetical protein